VVVMDKVARARACAGLVQALAQGSPVLVIMAHQRCRQVSEVRNDPSVGNWWSQAAGQ
jgi:hypothetical protein